MEVFKMICEQCGAENLDNASYCKKCGKIFKEDSKIVNTLETQFDDDEQIQNKKPITKKHIYIYSMLVFYFLLFCPLH